MNLNDLNLSQIDWKQIKTCEGTNGADLLKAFDELFNDDSNIREHAAWWFESLIVNQGCLYQGAYYCLPIFIKIVSDETSLCWQEAANVLESLVLGYSDELVELTELTPTKILPI